MEFRFESTIHRFLEDNKWGLWIYQTNAKRQVCIGLYVIIIVLFTAAAVYIEMLSGLNLAFLVLGIIPVLFNVFCAIYLIPRQRNWKEWEKQLYQVLDIHPEEKDGEIIAVFSESGCTLTYGGKTYERACWNRIEALRRSAEGWDFIDKPGFTGVSVRECDMTHGDAEAFSAHIQQWSKKKLKPRAIELSELQRRFPNKP